MANLLRDTLHCLKENNKTYKDIQFVVCGDYVFTPEEAKPMLDFEFDTGYGCQEVEPDLMLVGRDFWLERGTYDGSEWWEFKQQPKPTFRKDYPFSTFRTHCPWDDPEEYEDYISRTEKEINV